MDLVERAEHIADVVILREIAPNPKIRKTINDRLTDELGRYAQAWAAQHSKRRGKKR